jgi:hypothetical protein
MFASTQNRFDLENNVFLDEAIYKTAYYSANGDEWQSFSMQGDAYEDSSWIRNEATFNVPDALKDEGEHYIIFYSCHKEQTNNNDYEWNCHGSKNNPREYWQLIVINVNATNNQPPSGGGESTQPPSDPDEIEEPSESDEPDEIEDPNNPDELDEPSDDVPDELDEPDEPDEPSICNCDAGYYCANNVCLMNVSGNTYFVAPNGNDTTGNGSYENPWQTMQKAISMTHAGDISYFRGGVYYPTTYIVHRAGLAYWKGYGYDGTPENPIRFFNYPGETPIFDNTNQEHLNGQRGLFIQDVDYAHYKGLTFRNVLPITDAQCVGVWAINSTNITFEQMTAHGFHGHGFFASSGSNNIYYLNCDSYNNNRGETTQASDGFNALLTDPSFKVYYKGCRAWGNSDDGFDMIYGGYAEFEDCWAFNIGPGDGNGFKIVTGLNQDVQPLMRKITNCISAGNKASGFHENSYTGIFNMHLQNSLAYKNGFAGFYIPTDGSMYPNNENIYRNNIAYDNAVHEAIALRGHWIHENNSWDSSVSINDEDFVKLPATTEELYSILSAPRKPDGSLPDLGDYFQLVEGSDLIDAGVVISGYHCETAGEHPNDDCLEWYGDAPDLGPFEYKE